MNIPSNGAPMDQGATAEAPLPNARAGFYPCGSHWGRKCRGKPDTSVFRWSHSCGAVLSWVHLEQAVVREAPDDGNGNLPKSIMETN